MKSYRWKRFEIVERDMLHLSTVFFFFLFFSVSFFLECGFNVNATESAPQLRTIIQNQGSDNPETHASPEISPI